VPVNKITTKSKVVVNGASFLRTPATTAPTATAPAKKKGKK
jgi:hypothetical protein